MEVRFMNPMLKSVAMKMAYGYLNANPAKNAPKLMKMVDRLDSANAMKGQRDAVRKALHEKDGNWYKLIMSLWDDIDPGVRRAVFFNFVINATAIGGQRQAKAQKENDCPVPWAILMDPTSACNLHCVGCWAAEYGNSLSMSLETMDDIVRQGKALGVYFYLLSGGEPLMRKKDVIALCERHPDCMFAAFTNGTLIDEAFASEMLRVKNFVPAISIEGFEEATDSRRGKGTHRAVLRAMEILKRRKLLFGASCCYTSQNAEVIGSEAFFDDMIERGAKFVWLFTYMPVGADAAPDLMVSPEQRAFMYRAVRAFRETKPIFTLDFWNDGEFVGGCIAGGRRYLHINAGGDIEPCAFIHYANTNVHTHTLLEALKSPLFMQYHKNQPFNPNHLRPCPLLDNPERLAAMVDASGARSTDLAQPEDVHVLAGKCRSAAENWAPVADRLWKERAAGGACAGSACADGACAGDACAGDACAGDACAGGACAGDACADGACAGGACAGDACAGGADAGAPPSSDSLGA
jgi:MoaA/NifB/PqqE/SkfB family radical SAM enzyme